MSNRAVCYLRSSKDRSDVSIDAQRRALHELAGQRGLILVGEYADAVESGKDDDRPAFQRLLRDLRAPGEREGPQRPTDSRNSRATRLHIATL